MTSQFEPTPEERAAFDEAFEQLKKFSVNDPLVPGSPGWEAAYKFAAAAFPIDQKREQFANYLQVKLGTKIPVCRNTKLAVKCHDYPRSGGKCDLCGRTLKQ